MPLLQTGFHHVIKKTQMRMEIVRDLPDFMFVSISLYLDITVVLPFIRTVNNQQERLSPTPSNETRYPPEKGPAPITGMYCIRFLGQRLTCVRYEADHQHTGTPCFVRYA